MNQELRKIFCNCKKELLAARRDRTIRMWIISLIASARSGATLASFAACMLTSLWSHAQIAVETLDNNTQDAITALLLTHRNNDEVRQELGEFFNVQNQLFDKLYEDPTFDKEADTAYLQSLKGATDVLIGLNDPETSDFEVIETLEILSKDFTLKVKATSLASSSLLTSKVKVIVNTYRDGQKVNGYEVRANTMWDITSKTAKIVFDSPTNNAEKPLAPGLYIFWIEQDGEIVQRRSNIEIGDDHQPTETIIFRL